MTRRLWASLVIVCFMLVAVLTYESAVSHSDEETDRVAAEANERQDRNEVFACDRRSTVIAAQIVDAGQNRKLPADRQAGYMRLYGGIANCPETVRTGKLVLLSARGRDAYVGSVARQMGFPDWNVQPDDRWAE